MIALVGVGFFYFVNMPMPWLLGSIVALAVASRFSFLSLTSPKMLSSPARAILGLTVGSAFNAEIVTYFSSFLGSLMLVFPFVALTSLAGIWYYKKVLHYDIHTAYFSAIPGGLLEMVSLAESFKTSPHKIVLNQSARLLFIVFTIPFIIEHWAHISLGANQKITQHLSETPLVELGLMAACALVGWKVALWLKIPGGTLIGPMIVGMFAYSLGFLHVRPPTEIINLIQLILGSMVGFVFVGVSLREIGKVLLQTLGYFFILSAVSAMFIALVWWSTDFPPLSILLAFSPGGQAEMNVMAIVVGANLPYVALHHVIRLFLVMGLAPVVIRWMQQKKG
ncbi:MAG: AbrB family transcriptional regulator [Campylobacterales bacterium]|nr:AbrB family transcriptional regulator [Campylobacterales bacterium]